jgi:hypothetical protein
MRKVIVILMVVALAFAGGLIAGKWKKAGPPSFHDMIVNHPQDLSLLVTPKDKRIRQLAAELKTPENAFVFVRDQVRNDSSMPAMTAGEMLTDRRASCLGKAVLLCSLYRAMGIPSAEVRIVTGEVSCVEGIVDHAWVEMEHDGACIQQDSTDLLGNFEFSQFRGSAYTQAFIRRETFTFNDRSFAVVSRLNQMKGSGHPQMRP